MERLIYEGRFLVNTVGGIMRQDDLRVMYGRVNWEKMFREADYHKIANIIYLASLGKGDEIPERWRERFFERYQKALRFGDVYREAQQEILMMMEMMNLPCFVISSCAVRELYPVPEMSACGLLKLLVDEKSYVLAKGYMVDLGYETDYSYKGYGEHMKNAAGFDMEIYYKLPLRTRLYDKNMKLMLETAPFWGRYKYVRGFSLENQFVYMLASAAYAYVTDALLIRNVLDLYVFHRMWKEKMNIESIEKRMEGFRVDELGKKILQIAYMWFGSKGEKASDGLPEDIKVYDILENRILSRGVLNNETDQQALKLERLVQREINREQFREKRAAFTEKWRKRRKHTGRMLRWVFPEYKYMCVIYPILEDFSILLPICWIWRGIRQLKGLLISNLFKKKKPD